jgi:hypothetical protein
MGRIKSASIIEAIIAAVIIVLLFAIVNTIFVNINSGTPVLLKIKATRLIDAYAYRAMNKELSGDMTAQEGELQIRKDIVEVINNKAVKVRFSVYDKKGKVLEEQYRILLIE